ncbi:hypothetical protein [Paraburkholderia humisilvae]|uniref:Uncharacterized protein n=1 Tax=Paraburkholderia humisilvae TaxID=627669 RepID=A0A6J5DMK7_9BURK|nr:hypothetical protein [Paraburkholderia humisilvae]CAB3754757.1 hypothetical protein LMG29542_02446 [Paraburkholderia humisilvae]
MEALPNGFAALAAMLGVDASVLRVVSAPWVADPSKLPVTPAQFGRLLDAAHQLAGQMNANAWEMAIVNAFDPRDILLSLPTAGVPRAANDDPTVPVLREIVPGIVVSLDPSNPERAEPGSVFRFGFVMNGEPMVEIYQPGGTKGGMSLDIAPETEIRVKLISIGFSEVQRYTPEQANAPLAHIAKFLAKG